jgi:hypothetical protein
MKCFGRQIICLAIGSQASFNGSSSRSNIIYGTKKDITGGVPEEYEADALEDDSVKDLKHAWLYLFGPQDFT